MKWLEKIENYKPKITSIILSIVFMLGGILVMVIFGTKQFSNSGWIQTDSIITNIQSETVTVAYYVEKLATTLSGTLNEYSSTWHVGDVVPIKYNPSNPYEFVSASNLIVIIPYIGGSVFIAAGLFSLIKQFVGSSNRSKTSKNEKAKLLKPQSLYSDVIDPTEDDSLYVDERFKNKKNVVINDPLAVSVAEAVTSDEETYTFKFKNKTSRNCVALDENNNEIYRCSKEDFNLFKGNLYSFSNVTAGSSSLHRLSLADSESTSYSNPMGICSYYFKIDKKIIWEYLLEKGINISLSHKDSKMFYVVSLEGHNIGSIVSKLPKTKKIFNKTIPLGFTKEFEVKCSKNYLDSVMLCAYTIARLSQFMTYL